MDKKEFAIFASALRTYFPRENILPNDQAMTLWYEQLKDIPYNVAEKTLNKWVASNKWSPSIADIREQAINITRGNIKGWGEAWEDVLRAIRRYGSYKEEEALESLDEVTRRAVKNIGYRNLCLSEEIQIDRANFRMIYENMQERVAQERLIPEQLREAIASITNKLEKKGD